MKIHFVDNNFDVIKALEYAFKGIKEIDIQYGNILDLANDAIVSPANSYGYMDGGIDKLYYEYFGEKIQRKVIEKLNLIGGSLPVGSAFTIKTDDLKIPYLIFAPTVELPGPVNPCNCYFAMSAILKEAKRNGSVFKDIYCPGLCTGVGSVDYKIAANEMLNAYLNWKRA
ncbi:MAG: macro domain-containing protein [Bacillota bacterium]